jgi:lysyl endopeptidase
MKKSTIFSFLFLTFLTCFSQEIDELPISWGLQLDNNINPILLPPLDLAAIVQEDSINDLDKSLPWRYGVTRPLVLNPNQYGEWRNVPNVGRIWRVH